jgi:pimeloyl-ACP methyl ester carboxylesterase
MWFTSGMRDADVRQRITFTSAGVGCAGWHYAGTNGACVVMAGGAGVPKEPATDRFAAHFHAAGFSVLAFDFRHVGESEGRPRQVVRIADQLTDWDAAIRCATSLPEVDPGRIAAWGFSLAAGHLFRVAARSPALAAVIAQTPLADNLVAAPRVLRYESLGVALGFPFLALADAVGGLLGREPRLIPLAGPRGTVAMLSTPDALLADAALNPDNRYPDWQQTIAARSVLPLMTYRPGRAAGQVRCPMLVVVCDGDQSAPADLAVRAAKRAPEAEVARFPGGHYAPFLDQHDPVVQTEIGFLRRHLSAGRDR